MTPLTDNTSDKRIVERVLQGDAKAFKEIIAATEGLVAQLVCRMISNTEDRRDLTQDVYVKAFRSLAGFKFKAKLSTWIAQITYNTCLNYLEKKKLVLAGHFNEEDDEQEWPVMNRPDRIAEEAELPLFRKELSEILVAEIDKLTPIYRTLIGLYHQEELSYQEISQITSLPEGTVKNYLFRARKALKKNILSVYKKEEL